MTEDAKCWPTRSNGKDISESVWARTAKRQSMPKVNYQSEYNRTTIASVKDLRIDQQVA